MMTTLQHLPTDLDPPAEGLTADELARAERWKFIYRLSEYWHLEPTEVKRRIFIEYLIETGRIGKGDRR